MDGKANGSDYTLLDSTVFFEPGEMFQDIELRIEDDLLEEGPEDFTVSLDISSVIGAWTGVRDSISVTIQDDDSKSI